MRRPPTYSLRPTSLPSETFLSTCAVAPGGKAATEWGRSFMAAGFTEVFSALCTILQRPAGKLRVSENSPTRFCLEGGLHPKHRKPLRIAWVEISKSYVSFHHMGVYARPDSLKGVSKKLRARMQGKSCFNSSSVDEPLFAELGELTVCGFEALQKLSYMQ